MTDGLLLVLIECLTDQLELSAVSKGVIRLKLAGLLVPVSVDCTVLIQLLTNWFFLRLWLPVVISAVSPVAVFGKFSCDEFCFSGFACSPSLAAFSTITIIFWRASPIVSQGLFSICPPIGDFHHLAYGFWLLSPEFLLEFLPPNSLLEGADRRFVAYVDC